MMAALKKLSGIALDELLQGMVDLAERMPCTIQRLVLDSRMVQAGDLFIAVPGHQSDGRKFIDDAIANGAMAVLWQSEQQTMPIPVSWRSAPDKRDVPVIAVNNLKDKVGVLADRFYQQPSKSMYTVGVTGTNGKTSCTQFIAQAMAPFNRCGVIGTMGWGLPDELQASSHTTPDAITCHAWLADMCESGVGAVAMEVSSHALDQGRVNGIHFNCAVFTNLSHEHLDYHGDMQTYANAKARLFKWQDLGECIINIDDVFGRELAEKIRGNKKVVTYGLDTVSSMPDIYADEITLHKNGITATIHSAANKAVLNSPLYGRFNLYNLLATFGVLLHAGVDFDQAMQRLASIQSISGRMQVLHKPGHPTIIVDYAHTPDALQQALEALKAHEFGQTWCVFGCGGDRDRAKRPVMGAIAERLASHVVLTNDNPRHETPEKIIDDIQSGMSTARHVVVELDRARAIDYALSNASSDDVVLVAGKGHETYQQVGDSRLPFSDQQVVQQILDGGKQ
jgi:UDP-N-acetylmuramoyl-L-alanyl-D-glutamate--2,6-diaminopimelate ligase